ncbi:hypothetical protein [Streptomyces sp. SM14]|uniref:hypothetical protein n=1 Tax=Streptomyces sp. SM14 TaxID=1736045 RepID=UPI0015E16352|nr:hypothetical protein [Streptomyces sp. SM14]
MGWKWEIAAVRAQLEQLLREADEQSRALDGLRVSAEQTRHAVLGAISSEAETLRAENRELRRLHERTLKSLTDTRAAVDATRARLDQLDLPGQPGHPAPPSDLPPPAPEPDPTPAAEHPEPSGPEHHPTTSDRSDAMTDDEANSKAHDKSPHVNPLTEARTAHARTGTGPADETPSQPTVTPRTDEHPRVYRTPHLDHLLKAAGMGNATLVCHRETWDFITEQTGGHPHFRPPEQVEVSDEGRIETSLSGRSVLAVLTAMRQVTYTHEQRFLDQDTEAEAGGDPDLATWALAATVYNRTSDAVRDVAHEHPDHATPVIILDDRTPPAPD